MANVREKSLQEMADVLGRHAHAFDEPESVQLMASVRAAGLLTDDEWQEILVWLDEAAQFLVEMESAETEDELGFHGGVFRVARPGVDARGPLRFGQPGRRVSAVGGGGR